MAHIKKISFIGYGHMAKAIAKPLLCSADYKIYAASPSLKSATTQDGLTTHPNNLSILPDSDVIILAVKPKDMASVLLEIDSHIPRPAVVISIAAGLKLSWLKTRCREKQAIVRSMPNLPVAINEGATPLIANQWVTPAQHALVTSLFEKTGMIVWTEDETDIDRYTALSGSGPAYVFQFIHALIKGAEQLGIKPDLAKKFALQMVCGAAHLAQSSPLEMDALIDQVASAKGTTAAALAVFQKNDFEAMVSKAMRTAHARAVELGQE